MPVMHFCRNCNKSDAQARLFGAAPNLKACSRCKCTYYCSRACQAADYEKHKAVCMSIVEMGRVGQECPSSVDPNSFFFRLHYIRIMNEIHCVTHQYSIDKKDVVLELDFCPSSYELRSPAFKGDFLVYPVQQVLFHKRDPSWYHPYRGTTKHSSWMSVYVERVRDIRSRIVGNTMITMVVNTSAGGSVGRFTLTDRDGSAIFTSDEALQMFPVSNLKQAKLVLERVGFKEYEILAQLAAFEKHGGGNYMSG